MTEATDSPPRRRLLRTLAGGVVLGLIGVAVGRLLVPETPALVADLGTSLEAINNELDRRVRSQFPTGSLESAMISELMRQGFSRSSGDSFRWHQASNCVADATISWRAENGRIVSTAASYFRSCG